MKGPDVILSSRLLHGSAQHFMAQAWWCKSFDRSVWPFCVPDQLRVSLYRPHSGRGVRMSNCMRYEELPLACHVTRVHFLWVLSFIYDCAQDCHVTLPLIVSSFMKIRQHAIALSPFIWAETLAAFSARPSCPSKHRLLSFLRYWMLHEAYVGSFCEQRHARRPF